MATQLGIAECTNERDTLSLLGASMYARVRVLTYAFALVTKETTFILTLSAFFFPS